MLLYLLRHADADTVAATDDQRALSDKGVTQAEKVARFCKKHDVLPDVIFTSPLRRAHQTAAPVEKALEVELRVARWLASGMSPEAALEGLREYAERQCVMIVGHEPDFSRLAAHLLGMKDAAHLNIRKASLTLLEVAALRAGAARLQFSIRCSQM